MNNVTRKIVFYVLALVGGTAVIAGCSGSSSSDEAVIVNGDLPIVFAKRDVTAVGNPTDAMIFRPGGDLITLDLSSPSASEKNITTSYTQGAGDVSDPEVSFDGQRILFSMRGPNDSRWNVFEYDAVTESLTRIIADDAIANAGDDVDPAYLPDGRIVFSSNRQERSRQVLADNNIEPYSHRDEYEREAAILLHVMNGDGTDVHQISFNQSHDRNPTVLNTGEVMFARWDHVGNNNHFPIFFTNPDGTNIFVQYGAFSPGNSMLHPREMPDGRVLTSLMSLSGTFEGGALVAVDIRNFSEFNQPSSGAPQGSVGQKQVTPFLIEFGRDISENGRYTTPYPLWDGTNRALVSWSPFRPDTEIDPFSGEEEEVEGEPLYGVYMLDMENDTQRPIALPEDGFSYIDPIALAPRPVPNTVSDKPLNAALAAEGMGVLNVKSVYDTDFLDIMGDRVLVGGESIPKTAPPPDDTRGQVADILMMKDPAMMMADERPGRFVRVSKAVPTPPGVSMDLIGETDMEMQQIIGYSEVEPDGSFRIKVPADMALGLTVVDSDGRALQTHTNWIQVRPGETRTCNGCHSPRRGSAINSAGIAGSHPNTKMAAEPGESMAETRTRLTPLAMDLKADMDYQDVWTDPVMAGRAPDADLMIDYSGLTTAVPVNGVINYPDHVAVLWTKDRGADTCTNCHNNNIVDDPVSVGLDLRDTTSGSGRVLSYDELLIGDPIIDPDTGLPVLRVNEDEIEVVREPALVNSGSSSMSSRTSHLIEKLYEEELRASQTLVTTVDHSGMLNQSEKRIAAEWVDVGAQFYNDPFDDANLDGFRALSETRGGLQGLSESVFVSDIQPILMAQCAACHQPFGLGSAGLPSAPVNPDFLPNRFVLTGAEEGDFNIAVSFVSDVCNPDQNALLVRPTSNESGNPPHPTIDDPTVDEPPNIWFIDNMLALDPSSIEYQTIFNWIAAGTCN